MILDWEAALPVRWFSNQARAWNRERDDVLGKIYIILKIIWDMLLNWEVTLPVTHSVRWFSKWNRERDEVLGKGWQGDQLLSTYFFSPDLFSLRDERSHLSIWCPHEHSSSLLPFALPHLWGLCRVMSSSSRFYCLGICRPWLAFSLPLASRWTKTQTLSKKTSTQAYLVLKKCWKTSLKHDEQQRHVWIAFPKWRMACFLWIPSILLCCFAKHSLWPLILFSLRYDLLLLGKDNALNCGWLSYAERSTCAGKSSHQARPGYSASSKICTYCSCSQTGVGYAAYYRQCAGD